jgi:hypothetical protein
MHQHCTIQPVINLYHKQVHQPCTNMYLNLYYQQVHQSCTKYVPIMHQIHINYDSSRCTNIINYTPHLCANSSTTCLNHVPNMYLNKIPHQFHHQNLICHIYLKHYITSLYLKPCARTSLLYNLYCTNNFSNIPQPKSLKHEPILKFSRSTSDQLYSKP